MNEKLDLTPEKTDKSAKTDSEKKSEKDSIKFYLKGMGAVVLASLAMGGGLYAAEYFEAKGPEVIYDKNRVEYVIESGDTLEDLIKNVNKEIFVERKIVLDFKEIDQLNNKIEDESNSEGINSGDEISANITRFKNTNDHIRSEFEVEIKDPSKDAE